MLLRKFLKKILFPILNPLSRWYLRKPRNYTYNGLKVKVIPGVFHPGLFFSTKILLRYLEGKNLAAQSFLELGAGSGMIALNAAKRGALVTATDISNVATSALKENAQENELDMQIIHSDLFEDIPVQTFDWIVINPPYYPGDPRSEADYAWYCGAEFEYFKRLFTQLPGYMSGKSKVMMILSEDCDLERITDLAHRAGVKMWVIHQTKVWGESNYIYQLV